MKLRLVRYWLTRTDDKCWYHNKKWYKLGYAPLPYTDTVSFKTFAKAKKALNKTEGFGKLLKFTHTKYGMSYHEIN